MNQRLKNNTMKTFHLLCICLASAGALSTTPSAFSQGSLNPPGAPAPTMKRLDEVEPRINLQGTPAPDGVDSSNADYHFIINQPGSYYLSANLLVTKTNGIQINAEGVTLDLNGFQISRSTPGGYGIEILSTSSRATIRNGTVKGFSSGIYCLSSGNYAKACAFRDLAVTGCTTYGILAGPGAILESCRAHDNSGNAAISAEIGSSLFNCTASNNSTGPNCIGIRIGRGSTMAHCTVADNSGPGILASEGSIVRDCVAYSNTGTGIQGQNGCTITNSSSLYNLSTGITTGDHSTVSNCNVSNNDTGGIVVPNESIITSCTVSRNKSDGIRCNSTNTIEHNAISINGGASGTGDGINAGGDSNRIDSNEIRYNAVAGLRLPDNGRNVATRNILMGNTGGNYVVGPGNGVGPIISISAGNVSSATNSPFANIQN
jgi:parallel beta helix pectate lyase-like protein